MKIYKNNQVEPLQTYTFDEIVKRDGIYKTILKDSNGEDIWRHFLILSNNGFVIIIDNNNNICCVVRQYNSEWCQHKFVEVNTSITFDNKGE